MRHLLIIVCLALVVSTVPATAQSSDPLNIYGFFQGVYMDSRPTLFNKNTTFSIQQMNIFLSKDLAPGFSSFIGIEMTNSYSSSRQWGGIGLEEAWLRYAYSPLFNVKFGQLVPQFANLNEVKNRTPLLPYIQRPLVYEASYATILDFLPYYPALANLQIYGTINLGEVKGDYAVFAGNSDPKYVLNNATSNSASGWDRTTSKMVGGRVGVRAYGAKAGVSATFDRHYGFFGQGGYGFIPNDTLVGDLPRRRVALDVSYTGYGFFFESEAMFVTHTLNSTARAFLNTISQPKVVPIGPGMTMTIASPYGNSLDKMFMYANLGYDITDEIYAYVGWSNTKDNYDKVFENMVVKTLGAGYRPTESVVLKAQFAQLDLGVIPFEGEYIHNVYMVAASVSF